jgi:hypothetical protein
VLLLHELSESSCIFIVCENMAFSASFSVNDLNVFLAREGFASETCETLFGKFQICLFRKWLGKECRVHECISHSAGCKTCRIRLRRLYIRTPRRESDSSYVVLQ